jgi:hypothetical protein
MVEASQPTLIPSLAIQPTLHFEKWVQEVENYAASLFTEHLPNGLLDTGITKSDDDWLLQHPTLDGIVIYRPTYNIPDLHVAGASVGTISIYNTNKKLASDFRTESGKLRRAIIASIGPTITLELGYGGNPMHQRTVPFIINK